INECERNNGGCQHRCINVEGSYSCDCNPGWQLGNDGRTCYSRFHCILVNSKRNGNIPQSHG
ncbi:unnamed protein product, partial [Rodentolepis nana]|uniref:EGF-like domain-containing protein n=1 Tax=Rodentolepis nana TaxID=102285 RepID=A0A0R3T629_RODNA